MFVSLVEPDEEVEEEEDEEEEPLPPGQKKSNLKKSNKKRKKKRKIKWADDRNLRTFHYFELDENERGKLVYLKLF